MNTCCFFGHRTINETEELRNKLTKIIENIINDKNVNTFLFGSMSRFNSLCLEIVTDIKQKYPRIKRVYVRAEFPYISDDYLAYLLQFYDETYYPEKILGAGRASYVERNQEIINKSQICVVYYDSSYSPKKRKSGTEIAFKYAQKRGKDIINVLEI